MAFIPFCGIKKGDEFAITVDNQGRICLSAGLRKKLESAEKGIELVLFFEKETRRIGIATNYPDAKAKRYKFDNRGGTSYARDFLDVNEILYREGAVRYQYDGMIGDVMTFRAAQNEVRIVTTFRADKNGNLERLNDEAM